MEDQYIKLGLKVHGREDVEALRQSHKGLKDEVYDLADATDALSKSAAANQAREREVAETYGLLDRRVEETRAEYDRLDDAIRDLAATERSAARATAEETAALRAEAAAASTAAAAVDGTGKSSRNTGYAVMELGRIFQDVVQGGFGGGINNIERLTTSLGGTAGMAGAATAVGVALFLLRPQIEQMAEAIGLFGNKADDVKTRVEALNERIKELESKPHKLSVDYTELENARKQADRIQEALAALDKLRKSRGAYERESGSQIGEMFAEAPGGGAAVEGDLRKQFIAEAEAASGRLQKARDRARNLQDQLAGAAPRDRTAAGVAVDDATLQAAIAKAQEEAQMLGRVARDQGLFQAGDLIRRAEEGQGGEQRGAQAELADRLRKAGRRELAAGVESSSPEALQAQEEADAALEESIQAQKRGIAARKERAKKRAEIDKAQEEIDRAQSDLDLAARQGQEAEKRAREKKQGQEAADARKAADEAAKRQDKDRADLAFGLGNDFLAQAEAARLGIETDPTLSERQKRDARFRFGGDLQREAYRQLLQSGRFAPDRAAELAQGAGGFVEADIQRQINLLRTQSNGSGTKSVVELLTQLQSIVGSVSQRQQATARQLSALEQRNRELERMQGGQGWGPQRRVQ